MSGSSAIFRMAIYDGSVAYKLQFDFAGGDADLKDAYVAVPGIPVLGTVKAGHYKEPFGLEFLTSSKYITFLERSLTQPFTGGRNAGISLSNATKEHRFRWTAGFFRISDDFGNTSPISDDQFDAVARLTGTPYYEDGGRKVGHIGAAGRWVDPIGGTFSMDFAPESHLAPDFVRVEMDSVNRALQAGGELALVLGSFSFQGEAMLSRAGRESGDRTNTAFYVMGSYFLTGENRAYDLEDGTFGRVSPNNNFHPNKKGAGAWEVTVRLSQVTTDEALVVPGELRDLTLGLNWHLNPATRIMFNYVRGDLEEVGTTSIFQTRLQVDF